MASLQDDSEDSRTLLAGRKRGFEEATQDQELHGVEESGPHKRARGASLSHEQSSSSKFVTVADSLSPATSSSKLEVEASMSGINASSAITAANNIVPSTKESQDETQISEAAQNVRQEEEARIAAAPPIKPSWNNATIKGLRTSFGTKKGRALPMTISKDASGDILESHTASTGQEFEMSDTMQRNPASSESNDATSVPILSDVELQDTTSAPQSKKPRERRKKTKATREELLTELATMDTPLPPFKWLKKAQVAALSSKERGAYNHARRLHLVADSESQQKSDKEKPSLQRPVEREDANVKPSKADKHKNALAKVELTTLEVGKLMSQHGWPLPAALKEKALLMYNGETQYPRKYDLTTKYSKGKVGFVITPNFDSQGLPIKFPEISYNEWAVHFLTSNPSDWSALASSSLANAFNVYVRFFYTNHYGDEDSWRKIIKSCSSPDKNVFTLEQAVAEAKRRIALSPSVKPSQAKIAEPGSVSNVVIRDEDSEDNDVIMIEDDETSEEGEASMLSTPSDRGVIDVKLNALQLSLQERYFPSAVAKTTTATSHCLACSRLGHDEAQCPELSCSSCKERHSTFRCPDRQRCSRCRERGHTREECPEKLGVPRSELQCDFCGLKEHLETECHRIWRSFFPNPNEIRTVKHIPIDCYFCGGSNHFGPDCGLRSGRILTGGFTWSEPNLLKYVDPTSDRRALSAGIDYSIPARKGFSIKGKANDPITFEDSSDDGESFIRPKIHAAERGQIKINGRQDARPNHGLPKRPASPSVPYRNAYDNGFADGEDPRYEMPSDRSYSDSHHNAQNPFHGRGRGGVNQKAGRPSNMITRAGRGSKGGRGRGRGRGRGS